MNKLRENFQFIISFAAIVGLVVGFMTYFAKASELEALHEDVVLVELRLDQKIVGDQLYETQKAIRDIEERNIKYTSDCANWPDSKEREQYKKLKVQSEELQKKKDRFMK